MCVVKNKEYRVCHSFARNYTEANYPTAQRAKVFANSTWTVAMEATLTKELTAVGASMSFSMITIGTNVSQAITESQLIDIFAKIIAGGVPIAEPSVATVSPGFVVLMSDSTGMSYRISHVATINLTEAKYPTAQRALVVSETSWTTTVNLEIFKALDATGVASISFSTIKVKPSLADPTQPALQRDQLVALIKQIIPPTNA